MSRQVPTRDQALDALVDELVERLTPRLKSGLADAVAEMVVERLLDHVDRPDGWMDSHQAAEYLSLTPAALDKYCAARTIPFEQDKSHGKRWFERSALDAWRRGSDGNAR